MWCDVAPLWAFDGWAGGRRDFHLLIRMDEAWPISARAGHVYSIGYRYITAVYTKSCRRAQSRSCCIYRRYISGAGIEEKEKRNIETRCWFKQEMWNCAEREVGLRVDDGQLIRETKRSASLFSLLYYIDHGHLLCCYKRAAKRLCVWAPADTCFVHVMCIWFGCFSFSLFSVSALQWTSSNNPTSRREDNERTVQQPRVFPLLLDNAD